MNDCDNNERREPFIQTCLIEGAEERCSSAKRQMNQSINFINWLRSLPARCVLPLAEEQTHE